MSNLNFYRLIAKDGFDEPWYKPAPRKSINATTVAENLLNNVFYGIADAIVVYETEDRPQAYIRWLVRKKLEEHGCRGIEYLILSYLKFKRRHDYYHDDCHDYYNYYDILRFIPIGRREPLWAYKERVVMSKIELITMDNLPYSVCSKKTRKRLFKDIIAWLRAGRPKQHILNKKYAGLCTESDWK